MKLNFLNFSSHCIADTTVKVQENSSHAISLFMYQM